MISLLIGIARGEGKVPDLDTPAIDHLPAKYADLRTPDNARITIRDLLTMSAGLDWDETRSYSDPQNSEQPDGTSAADPYRFVLPQQRASVRPGVIFNYSTGVTELLGLFSCSPTASANPSTATRATSSSSPLDIHQTSTG